MYLTSATQRIEKHLIQISLANAHTLCCHARRTRHGLAGCARSRSVGAPSRGECLPAAMAGPKDAAGWRMQNPMSSATELCSETGGRFQWNSMFAGRVDALGVANVLSILAKCAVAKPSRITKSHSRSRTRRIFAPSYGADSICRLATALHLSRQGPMPRAKYQNFWTYLVSVLSHVRRWRPTAPQLDVESSERVRLRLNCRVCERSAKFKAPFTS